MPTTGKAAAAAAAALFLLAAEGVWRPAPPACGPPACWAAGLRAAGLLRASGLLADGLRADGVSGSGFWVDGLCAAGLPSPGLRLLVVIEAPNRREMPTAQLWGAYSLGGHSTLFARARDARSPLGRRELGGECRGHLGDLLGVVLKTTS